MPPLWRATLPCAVRSRGRGSAAPTGRRLLVAFLATLLSACSASDGVVQPAAVEAGLSLPGGPLLLDVRRPEEFAAGFVPGAINIPVDELEQRMVEIESHAERGIVVYCESGRRAGRALTLLREAGFQNLALLDGSMRRWREENRPVARPASALRPWPRAAGAARAGDSG